MFRDIWVEVGSATHDSSSHQFRFAVQSQIKARKDSAGVKGDSNAQATHTPR